MISFDVESPEMACSPLGVCSPRGLVLIPGLGPGVFTGFCRVRPSSGLNALRRTNKSAVIFDRQAALRNRFRCGWLDRNVLPFITWQAGWINSDRSLSAWLQTLKLERLGAYSFCERAPTRSHKLRAHSSVSDALHSVAVCVLRPEWSRRWWQGR